MSSSQSVCIVVTCWASSLALLDPIHSTMRNKQVMLSHANPHLLRWSQNAGEITRTGLSQIICWRLNGLHPFVLLIRHREQTKLPKWSCQKLPTTTGAFLGDNKLAQAPFCQPIKFSIMSEPERGWGWLCGMLAHPWLWQQLEAGKWIHCPIRGTWLAGSCPCGALCGHSRVQTSRAASSPALNHCVTGHCRSLD